MKLLSFLIPFALGHEIGFPHSHKGHKPSTINFLNSLYNKMDKNRDGTLGRADTEPVKIQNHLPSGFFRSGRMFGMGSLNRALG